jgi:hypothetical protein
VIRRAAAAALVGFGVWLRGDLRPADRGLVAGIVAPVTTAATIDEALR